MLERLKYIGKEIYYFISSRIFLINFAKILGIAVGFLMLMFLSLQFYTRHGDAVKVGNYINKNMSEVARKLSDAGFNYIVTDSIYREGVAADLVIDQNPLPNSFVKGGRTIYLKITKAAGDLITLPDIAGRDDINFYRSNLEQLGIKIGKIDTLLDANLSDGTILKIIVRGKDVTDILKQGIKVPQGSTIDVVISKKETDDAVIQDVSCKTADQASIILGAVGITIGTIIPDASVTNKNTAYILKQEPDIGVTIKKNTPVTIYITQKKPSNCPENGIPEH